MNENRDKIRDYFRTLGNLGDRVLVTDADDHAYTMTKAFDCVISAIAKIRLSGGKLIFVGNGGSAAIASHMAIDFTNAGKVAAICFNDAAALTCLANDFGYENAFRIMMERHACRDDLLFAISSSGKSPNIMNAVGTAREAGIMPVTLSGFEADNPLRSLGDINFYVPSESYGHVEISHLAICHAILDLCAEWRAS